MPVPWQGARKAQERAVRSGREAVRAPQLCPHLTAAPLPGWSLPLLGKQYLDILTTWYCSLQDCCDNGDCRISNNFTGGNFHGPEELGICREER